MKKSRYIVFISIVFFGLAISAFIISCTGNEDERGTSVDKETVSTESPVIEKPDQGSQDQVDTNDDSADGDPENGKKIFAQNCVPCHGQDGTGEGPTAAALDPKPRDLTDASYVSTLSNEHLFKVISKGGLSVGKSAAMPAWSTSLSDDEIRDVISYIRIDLCNCEYDGG